MELVKSTLAAIAVPDDLTTLIDWVNIDQVEGFTITIANAGGGSADDITDIQIDTSDDGGVTVNLDQHAGVPAVPVAAGNAMAATFTESAAFVRIRAICGAGNDTTASAWLLADTSSARLCTVEDVKDRLGLSDTDHDVTIAGIITNLTSVFDSYTRRTLIAPAVDVTEYHTGIGDRLQLRSSPVISITSVTESSEYDFDNTDALVANTDYRLVGGGKNALLFRRYSTWLTVEDSIEAVYRGGYCAAGQTPGDGEHALPADLREAAIEQSCFTFKRRDDIGLSAVSGEGGSINKFAPMKLLPFVEAILKQYKRPSL